MLAIEINLKENCLTRICWGIMTRAIGMATAMPTIETGMGIIKTAEFAKTVINVTRR